LRKDAQKLKGEKTTLEGMIQSCDELIMEMAKEYVLNRMGKNDDDEDDDDEGNDVAPPAPAPTAVPEEIIKPSWRMVHKSWMTWMIWMMIQMKATLTWMSGFLKMGVMIEIESLSLSL
jgi:hypothetical protein